MELIAYYDEAYPANLLERHSKVLSHYLQSQGYRVLDAQSLGSWMRQRLTERKAAESSVVFCQDVVPDTVIPRGVDCSNVLLREYLDDGGRVVWLGDVPLWYRGIGRDSGTKKEEIWMHGVPWGMLGAVMLVAETSSLSRWVNPLHGIVKSRWYSMRPVNVGRSRRGWVERIAGAAQSCWSGLGSILFQDSGKSSNPKVTPMAYAEVTLLPCSYNIQMISRWRKAGRRVTQVSTQLGAGVSSVGLGAGIQMTESLPRELAIGKPLTLACAWHVTYNRQYPTQGFYRFLDAQVEGIGLKVLEDIHSLATLAKVV